MVDAYRLQNKEVNITISLLHLGFREHSTGNTPVWQTHLNEHLFTYSCLMNVYYVKANISRPKDLMLVNFRSVNYSNKLATDYLLVPCFNS